MGPKKGSKGEEWWQCGLCGRVVYKTDTEQHSKSCEATPTFLLQGVLHARATSTPSAAIRGTLEKVSFHCRENTVLVHPSTMAICGLAIGQPCIVNDRRVMTSWPCDALPPTSVFLSQFTMEVIADDTNSDPDCIVTVQRFVPSGREAQRVDIRMETDCEQYQTDIFPKMLACSMEGEYISENSRHYAASLGHRCAFCITAIHTLRPSPSPPHPDPLSPQFASFNLSNVSDSGDNCSAPATPVRPTGEITQAVQSPEVVTPERSERRRGDQFHTPNITQRQKSGEEFVKVTARTCFRVFPAVEETGESVRGVQKVMFDCVGGLDRQIEQLRTHCIAPLLAAKTYGSAAVAPSGILLFGPTGTGKSMLAQALANELDVYTVHISPADLYSKFFGETEKRLQNMFKTARQRSPSLIIVDHVDAVCPRRDVATSDLEKRTVTTFLSLMDSLASGKDAGRCIVIGLTRKPDDLDPALRRVRCFDLEIETGVPTAADRLQILKKMLCDVPHTLREGEVKEVADITHSYVGADLAGVVSRGRQHRWQVSHEEAAALTAEDLRGAIKQVAPSAMREVQFEVPQVRWSDIGGQEEVKLMLRQAVEWPITHPEAFRRMGITPPAGCLLYGPPGCSKTMTAKALATESGLNFLAVKGPDLFDKYVGESERAVREIFRKARSAAPSIIFFDEIDSLAVERGKSGGGNSVADRVLTQLLTEMDGLEQLQGVTILAATNRPDMIDQALLRPGRFDRLLYVPLPDAATRLQILQIVGSKTPMAEDVCLQDLVTETHNYSGAELTALCHQAALTAMTENLQAREVHRRHLDAALQGVRPQTSQDRIDFYESYTAGRRL